MFRFPIDKVKVGQLRVREKKKKQEFTSNLKKKKKKN